jgi:hypothetical protein
LEAEAQKQGQNPKLMEFVPGADLRQLLRAGPVPLPQVLAIALQVCDALEYAHGESVIHRDIKPENLLLDPKGRVKVADLGLAKLVGPTAAPYSLTGSHQVMGTPHYMAPEQWERPQAVDHRADIYALGVVLYELLTAELPLGRFAPPSAKISLDPRLDAIILQALEKDPDRRPPDVRAIRSVLESVAGPARPPTLPWRDPSGANRAGEWTTDRTLPIAAAPARRDGPSHRFSTGRLAAHPAWAVVLCGLGVAAGFLPWAWVPLTPPRPPAGLDAPWRDSFLAGVETGPGALAAIVFAALALLLAVWLWVPRPARSRPAFVWLLAVAGLLVLLTAPYGFDATDGWTLLAFAAPLAAVMPRLWRLPGRPVAMVLGGWGALVLTGLFVVLIVQRKIGLYIPGGLPVRLDARLNGGFTWQAPARLSPGLFLAAGLALAVIALGVLEIRRAGSLERRETT